MRKYHEEYTKIYKTNEYDMFKNILGNRKLQGNNYAKLTKSMKEELIIVPILVNEKLEIIDGQHRFEVCKENGMPVYYYIVKGYDINHVKKINQNGFNWIIADYLNMYCDLENKGIRLSREYTLVRDIMDKTNLKLGTLLAIFARKQNIKLEELKIKFEDGSFKSDKSDEVIEFVNKLKCFSKFKQHTTDRFTQAFLELSEQKYYNHENMIKQLSKRGYILESRSKKREYVKMLVDDIYNYGGSKCMFGYDVNREKFYEV